MALKSDAVGNGEPLDIARPKEVPEAGKGNPEEAVEAEAADETVASAARRLADIRRDRDSIRRFFETGEYPYKQKIRRKFYERQKKELQIELLKVQEWVKLNGRKIVILFEGRDAAGKGGTIKRFTEHLNPRGARVVALDKPT
ncbi:MAG: polyphosphate kinase 2, partial [Rhodospirillaceae bacterium]|nr:polyphosphate kinase 2 [Rhodospirillaceae bacterium]